MKKWMIFFVIMFISARAEANVSNEMAAEIMGIAREHITQAKLQDGSFVPAETEEEMKHLIIPIEDAKRVIHFGSKSGLAEWCGIEYRPAYLQFMQDERRLGKWNDKQIAYIGLLHGISVSVFSHSLQKTQGLCSEAQKRHMLEQLTE